MKGSVAFLIVLLMVTPSLFLVLATSPSIASTTTLAAKRSTGGPDVRPGWLQFHAVEPSWAGLSEACVGKRTGIDVDVLNEGDQDTSAVSVTITVRDIYNRVMDTHMETVPLVLANNKTAVHWTDWIPTYATKFNVIVTTDAAGDVNTTNDTRYYSGEWYVAKWFDGAHSQDAANWTGDIGAEKWHITNTIEDDPDITFHSSPDAWYMGRENPPLADSYRAPLNVSLVSPIIDLGRMNPDHMVTLNFKYYGESHPQDALTLFMSDDAGAHWHFSGTRISAITNMSNPVTGHPEWLSRLDNVADMDGDGTIETGEYDIGVDVTEYLGSKFRFKLTFLTTSTLSVGFGFYLDDFVVNGIEDQRELYVGGIANMGVTAVGVDEAMTTAIVNSGLGDATDVPISLDIFDSLSSALVVHAASTVTVPARSVANVTWHWTPETVGDYRVKVTLMPGQQDDDSLFDNMMTRRVHVSDGNATVLVVDDDCGVTNGCRLHYRGITDLDVDDELTGAVQGSAGFDVYRVQPNGDGPSFDLMAAYDTVIWSTGYDGLGRSTTGTLSEVDMANIARLLDGHGALWLISMEVMFDLQNLGRLDFSQAYLHVIQYSDDAGTPAVIDGVGGDPIGAGLAMTTSVMPEALDRSDIIAPGDGAHGVLYASDTSQGLNGPFNTIAFSTTHKLLFTSFEMSYIAGQADRGLFASRALNWLYNGMEFVLSPDSKDVDAGGNVSFQGTIVNRGYSERSVDELDIVSLPSGWKASVSPTVKDGSPLISLGPGSSIDIALNTTSPGGAKVSTEGLITVGLVMMDNPKTLLASAKATIKPTVGISFSVDAPSKEGNTGENVTFLVSINDTGNIEEYINLTLGGEAGPWAKLEASAFALQPGKRRDVVLSVSVPRDSEARTYGLDVTAKATAGSSGSRLSVLSLGIRVRPFRSIEITEIDVPSNGRMDPAAGDPFITITAEIRNDGNGPENVTVRVIGEFEEAEEWDLPTVKASLDPFEERMPVNLRLRAGNATKGGTYSLKVEAVSDVVADVMATAYFTVHVLRPDLYIAPQDIVPKDVSIVDQLSTLSMRIRNGGDAPTTVFAMTVTVDYAGDKVVVADTLVTRIIPPGSDITVEVDWVPRQVGNFDMKVSLDPNHEVIEHDETDNIATRTVTILQPDLDVTSKGILFNVDGEWVNDTMEGRTVAIFMDISNAEQFTYEARKVNLVLLLDGTQFETQTTTIEAGTTYTWVVEWKASAGTHTFTLKVDPEDTIAEQSEDNNLVEATLAVSEKEGAGGLGDLDMSSPLFLLLGIVVVAASAGAYFVIRRPGGISRSGDIVTARKRLRCAECGRPIPKGNTYYRCRCGRPIHRRCARQVGVCECLRRNDI